jgi:PAS domain S-box-containing protein
MVTDPLFWFSLVLAATAAWGIVQRMRLIRENKNLRHQLDRGTQTLGLIRQRQEGFAPLLNVLTLELDSQGRISYLKGWRDRPLLNDALGKPLADFLPRQQNGVFREAWRRAETTDLIQELDCPLLDDKGREHPVRLTLRSRHMEPGWSGEGMRLVIEDISGEVRSRRVLTRKKMVETTTSRILHSIVRVSADNLEETLGLALNSLSEVTTVDRCHLVFLDPDGEILHNKFQWCGAGMEPVGDRLMLSSLAQAPWFRSRVHDSEVICISDPADLPPEAGAERRFMISRRLQALLIFPLFREEEVFGFLVMSALQPPVGWDGDGMRMLSILADALGSVLHRRQFERALQAANRQLMDIISFLPDATFVINSEKKVVAWNKGMEELTGVPGREMLGRGDYAYSVPFYGEPVPILIDHFGDADLNNWRKLYDFVEINGDTLYAETFVPFLNDGKGAYLWHTASPLYDSEGQIVGAIQSLRDVTDRKKAEEDLRASEMRFRRLIETMTDGLAIFDRDGVVSFANTSLCAMLGHTMHEVLGSNISGLLPEISNGKPLAEWPGWQLDYGEGLEMSVRRPGGSTMPLRVSGSHLVDRSGRFNGGMALVADMTPMHEAEDRIRTLNLELEQKVLDGTQELLATNKALRQSEERYRRIIENLSDGYIFYSREPAGDVTYVSPSFTELLGYEQAEQFAVCRQDWLRDPRNEKALCNVEKTVLGYRQPACDLHVKHRDGRHLMLEMQESPVFDHLGQVISVEGLLHDVTKDRQNLELIRQAQQQLVESEKMAALGSLVAGLSHEINTPVGIGVTAASHLVQEARDTRKAYEENELTRARFEQFIQVAQESASLIQTNLNRSADLLQNFKLVATDQTADQERTFRLGEYLDDVIQSLGPRFRNTGFKIHFNCPDDLEMHCDPSALYHVLTNLVMNSLIHGFEGLLVGEISITARRDNHHIELDYRDNGNGMGSKELARLYEPFFTTKRGRGGTGLGMHIVYNNVTQTLGGTISCASKPGRGTRFNIRVPLMAEVEHG